MSSTATKTATTTKDPTWQQVAGQTHRWELKRPDGSICATLWLESDWWHWSVPARIPERGARRIFREAVSEAEAAAKRVGVL